MAEYDSSIGDGPTIGPVSASGGGRRLAAGDTILGRYAVVRELGEGGMGVVYQCLDTVGGVEVAVKGLPPEVSRNEDEMDDIRANYQIVRKLRHPNIAGVATLEKDSAAGDYYLVMDLAAGTTLKRWSRHHPDAGLDAKLAILRQVAAALDYAHAEKVIHRDVKPENVMVDDDGRVKVLDFGLAAQIRSSQSRTSNTVTSKGGTPGYKSPEQWLGRPQQAPADVYAFGVIAYWLFSGHLPFDGDDSVVLGHAVLTAPVEPITDLPAHMNAALAKALAKAPEDRFSSCTAFVDALENRTAEEGRACRDHRGRRHPGGLWKPLLAVAALALVVAGGWWWSLQGRKTKRATKTTLAAGSTETARTVHSSEIAKADEMSVTKRNAAVVSESLQCKNNMHHLATAAISYVQANGEYGHFPAAGFYRTLDMRFRRKQYYPHRSWISNKGNISDLNRTLSDVYLGEVAHFSDAEDDCRTAVTNGAIWQATGQSLEIYRCPVHAREYERKYSRKPGWSYVMNQEFGYNWNNGKSVPFCGASINSPITVATTASGLRKDGTGSRSPDKVLMFAEVQAIDIQEEGYDAIKSVSDVSGPESDAVLEYTKESIGFNHRTADGRYYGHVVFADGHVEEIFCPRIGSPLNRFELTRALCQGVDVVYDPKSGSYSVRPVAATPVVVTTSPTPVIQPAAESAELVRLREELQRQKDERHAEQAKRDKEQIALLKEQLAKAQQQPLASTPPVVVTTASTPVVQPGSESEIKRLLEESRKLKAQQDKYEKERKEADEKAKKEAEKEAFRRRQYPDIYAKMDAEKEAAEARAKKQAQGKSPRASTHCDESNPGEDPELAELLKALRPSTPAVKPQVQPPVPKPAQSTQKTETLTIGGAGGGSSIPWLIEVPRQ